jgi:hypothetical protein
LEIKKAFPIFQVSIYDNVAKSSALMELPAASARRPLRDVGRTWQERIDDFIHKGSPPIDQPLQILCEDHVGTYVIPFPCRWREGIWENAKTSRRIEATVVGWRALNKAQR